MDIVNDLVGDNAVVIFSRSYCGIGHTIKSLIRGFGANTTVYELDEMPNGGQIERALQQMHQKPNSSPTLPAAFIGQQFVGGSNEVMSLHLRNQLVPMLLQANAIWI